MGRRVIDAAGARGPAVDVERPASMPASDPDVLVRECREGWSDICPAADIKPFVERFAALPAVRRGHLSDVVRIQQLDRRHEPPELFTQAEGAMRSFADGGDLATLLVLHDDSRFSSLGREALMHSHYAPARAPLFELLFSPARYYTTLGVRTFDASARTADVVAALGPIDDAMITRALAAEAEAIDADRPGPLRLLALAATTNDRVLSLLVERLEQSGFVYAVRGVFARRGLEAPELIPRLEAMLRNNPNDAEAAAHLLAAWGVESGKRYLERATRKRERDDPYR